MSVDRLRSILRKLGRTETAAIWRIRNRVTARRSFLEPRQMDQSNLANRRSMGSYRRAFTPCDDRQVATGGVWHKWVPGSHWLCAVYRGRLQRHRQWRQLRDWEYHIFKR